MWKKNLKSTILHENAVECAAVDMDDAVLSLSDVIISVSLLNQQQSLSLFKKLNLISVTCK